MDRIQILELIGEEITRLERARDLLTTTKNGHHSSNHKAKGVNSAPKKRFLSEEARNRIAQAQKRRWAKQRKETALVTKKA